MNLSPAEQERYARQLGAGVLSEEAQLNLRRSTALVTRVGGMGGPAALMLTMAGHRDTIGHLRRALHAPLA